MGMQGEDLLFSPGAGRLLRISVECKSRERVALYAWYEQAKQNSPNDREPVVVFKQNRSRPLVALDAEEFFRILKQARSWDGQG
jgi:hypothetical protein